MSKFNHWCSDIPEEEGWYWLFGNPYLGQMGCHYFEDHVVEKRIYLVEIIKVGIGATNGQIIYLKKFDKEKKIAGILGYWKNAELPEFDDDPDGIFGE